MREGGLRATAGSPLRTPPTLHSNNLLTILSRVLTPVPLCGKKLSGESDGSLHRLNLSARHLCRRLDTGGSVKMANTVTRYQPQNSVARLPDLVDRLFRESFVAPGLFDRNWTGAAPRPTLP